jgi:hypothetical protein
MPVNKTVIKIVVEGTPTAKQQLDQLKNATDKVNKAGKNYSKGAKNMRGVTKGMQREVGRLRNIMLLYSFAIGGTIAAIKKLVNIYRVQLESEAKIQRGMKNVADATDGAADRLIALAGAYQQITTFGDEAIISAQAMLSTFQLNEKAIAELTPRILDMAAATGQDLQSAAIMVGKAFTGQASAMSRAGVVIDEFGLQSARSKGPTEEFSYLVGELDKNFEGFAQALADTDIGKLDQLRNKISDLNEETGKVALPILVNWNNLLFKGTKILSGSSIWWETYLKSVGTFTEKKNAATIAMREWLKVVEESNKKPDESETKGPEAAVVIGLKEKLRLLREELGVRKLLNLSTSENYIFNKAMTDDEISSLVNRNTLEKQLSDTRMELSVQEREIRLAGANVTTEQQEKYLKLRFKEVALDEQIKQAKVKATGAMIGSFAALNEAAGGNAKVGAKMAQASAIINMYAGANKALEQGGFLGIAMAASVIASGMANVINIEKQMSQMNKAATGASFITDGPQMMLVGESGRESVNVVPLEGPNIAGPQTSPVSINITGNVLSNEFVMDEVIPAIKQAATMNLA